MQGRTTAIAPIIIGQQLGTAIAAIEFEHRVAIGTKRGRHHLVVAAGHAINAQPILITQIEI